MATTINVDGQTIIFNNMLLLVNGDSNAVPINGYATAISCTTGTRADHVVSMTEDGWAIDTNTVFAKPTGSISFAPMMSAAFSAFLNDQSKFQLIFDQYVTGNMKLGTQSIIITGAQLNERSLSAKPESAQNDGQITFVARKLEFL